MSPFTIKHSNNDTPLKTWVHEICRIWCVPEVNDLEHKNHSLRGDIHNNDNKLSYMCSCASLCAICGISDFPIIGNQKESMTYTHSSFSGLMTMRSKYGKDSFISGLTKCAARGCSVTFHALCAILTTKLRRKKKSVLDNDSDTLEINEKELKLEDVELCQQYTLEIVHVKRMENMNGNLPGIKKQSYFPIAFCGIHNPKRHKSFYGCPPAASKFSSFIKVPYVLESVTT